MKTEKNIFIAFILNLAFSLSEFIGGMFIGSVAIVSDAVHDMGDAASIGISYLLERKSKKQADEKYTYGYARFSVLGSVITNLFLLIGSGVVIYNAVLKIINPAPIDYNGMIIFAIFGFCINLAAAIITRKGDSLNQKAVNLHMLEDVLGWAVVLAGAVIMKFTDLYIIDPLMSLCVAVFIVINAVVNLHEVVDIFLEKTPQSIDMAEIKEHICGIDGVLGVHHVHIWSIDGNYNYATMHIVSEGEPQRIKEQIREELNEHGISHVTIELESSAEHCCEESCRVAPVTPSGHHHHHH